MNELDALQGTPSSSPPPSGPPPDGQDPLTGQPPAQPTTPAPDQSDQPDQTPTPSPSDLMLQATAVHHSRLADALNAVGRFLGGGTTMHLVPHSDGSFTAEPVESTPGERWGRIAQAALQGAAKGFAAGQGPGGQARALNAGVQAGAAMPQAQVDQTLNLANQMNKQNRDRLLFNANMAMMDQQLITAKNNNQRSGVIFGADMQQKALERTQLLRSMGAIFKGNYKDDAEMYLHAQDPENVQAHTGQSGMYMPNIQYDSQGRATGVDGWVLPEDKRSQLLDKDMSYTPQILDPQGSGKVINGKPITWEKGTATYGDVWAAIKAFQVQENTLGQTVFNNKNATRKTDIEQQQANIEQQRANTEASKAANEKVGEWQPGVGTINGVVSDFNPKLGTWRPSQPGMMTAHMQAANDKRTEALNKRYGDMRNSLKFANDYMARVTADKNAATGPQDEILQDKFFNFAKPGTGFRMTTPQITQLQNAQSMINAVRAKVGHATGGTFFSPEQRKQIVDAMKSVAVSNGLTEEGDYTPQASEETPEGALTTTPAPTAPPVRPPAGNSPTGSFNWDAAPAVR